MGELRTRGTHLEHYTVSRLQDLTKSVDASSDTELVDRTRGGDAAAYAELWSRHYRAGLAVARSFTGTFDPDDLVSEAFTKIYTTISRGGGPTAGFRPYLFTAIRNTAASWGRGSREIPMEFAESIPDVRFTEENQLTALNGSLAAQAFRALPSQWQEILWYTEVEGMPPRDVAPLMGMRPNAVAALAYRAREGLRASWIQVHLASLPAESECRWTIEHLGASFRKKLTKPNQRRVDEHLGACPTCPVVAEEADEANRHIGFVLLPLAAGVGGAAAYTAWMATDGGAAAFATEGALAGEAVLSPSVPVASAGVTLKVSALVLAGAVAASMAVTLVGALAPEAEPPTIAMSAWTAVPPAPRPAVVASIPSGPAAGAPAQTAPPAVAPQIDVRLPASPAGPVRVAPAAGPLAPSPSPSPSPSAPATPAPLPAGAPAAPSIVPPAGALAAPVILSPRKGTVQSDLLLVHGSAGANAAITVQLLATAGQIVAQAADSANPSGMWTAPMKITGVPDGQYTLSVVASQGLQLSQPASVPVTVGRTLPDVVVTAIDGGGRLFPVLTGTGTPGATVHAVVGPADTTASVDPQGNWTMPLVDGLAAGGNTVTVTQTLSGETSSPLLVDAPLHAPVLTLTTASNSVVITGDAGAAIELRTGGGAWTPGVLDATGGLTVPISTGTATTVDVRYAEAGRYGLTSTIAVP
jgi:RNA polymerase sigma factor (sigma-70 family)